MWFGLDKIGRLFLTGLVLLSLFQPSEASAERRRRVFGRRVIPRGVRVRQNFIRLEDLKEVPGFTLIKQLGNNLVEQTTDAFGQIRVSRLFIDGGGRLLGATRFDTVRQVREFFLQNFDNFRGNALNVVRRFLQRNGAGAVAAGGLFIDIGNSVTPPSDDEGKLKAYVQKAGADRVKLAALSFLINTISQSSRLFIPSRDLRNFGRGVVGTNPFNFLSTEAAALLTSNNPYDCTGTGRAPFRLDFLISRAMDPEIYYRLIGAPRTLQELANQQGIQSNPRAVKGRTVLIAAGPKGEESIVGRHPQRRLQVQDSLNVPGGYFYWSLDNPYNVSGPNLEATDVFKNGQSATFAASEMIFRKRNGFMAFYLANAAGQRAASAPNEFASAKRFNNLSKREGHSNDVSAPVNCLVCHSVGMLGGGKSLATGQNYTEHLGKIPPNERVNFTTLAAFNSRRIRDSVDFLSNVQRAEAFIPDPDSQMQQAELAKPPPATLLPDFVGEFNARLDMAKAARELGTSVEVARQILPRIMQTDEKGTISRNEFQNKFCLAQRAVQGQVASNGNFQTPIQSRAAEAGVTGLRSFSGQSHSGSDVAAGSSSRPAAQ